MALLDKWKLLKNINADVNLNSSARRIMFYLLDRENSRTKALYPSHSKLSKDSNLSSRQVIRAIKSLIENGYLKILQRGCAGRASSYKIHYVPIKVKVHDKKGKKGVSELSHQSINSNPLINPVTGKKKVDVIIGNITKKTNSYYKEKIEKGSFAQNVYTKILNKTQDTKFAEEWLQLFNSSSWQDKVKAEKIARHLQCMK